MKWGLHQLLGALLGLCLVACRTPSTPSTVLSALTTQLEELRARGAVRCAPRHMAIAVSHQQFAALELQQGVPKQAASHIWTAQRQLAAATLILSTRQCGGSEPVKSIPRRVPEAKAGIVRER